MNMMPLPRMLFSARVGGDEIERTHPHMDEMFRTLVLPLSWLPRAMILYASGGLGAELLPQAHIGSWLLPLVAF